MKKINVYTICAILMSVFNVGCESEWGDVIVNGREAYKYLPTFQNGMIWDEVTYQTSNPTQFMLEHYEIMSDTLTDGTILNILYRNSKAIGTISKDENGKVYFIDKNNLGAKLLYDFSVVDKNIGGTGSSYNTTSITLYKDLPREYKGKNRYDIPSCYTSTRCIEPFTYKWTWMNDIYGGITINGVGSTAGILSPVEPVKAGYSREVLQVYNKYSSNHQDDIINWYIFQYHGLEYSIFNNGLVYNNFEQELMSEIPYNVWKSPAIFSELLNKQLISNDDYKNILQIIHSKIE